MKFRLSVLFCGALGLLVLILTAVQLVMGWPLVILDRAPLPARPLVVPTNSSPSSLVSSPTPSPYYLPLILRGSETLVTPTTTATPPHTSTATNTPTPMVTPMVTKTPTITPTPTHTAIATVTPTAINTPTNTPMPAGPMPPFGLDMAGRASEGTLRDLVAAAGIRWIRTSVSWAGIEPSNIDLTNPQNGNWPDSQFRTLHEDGRFVPIVLVLNNPSWAASVSCGPIDPAHLSDFGEFVRAMAERYDGDGIDDAPGSPMVEYWSFYNEEDQIYQPGVETAGGCWGNHGAEYAQMLAVAWQNMHEANPQTKIFFGAPAYEPRFDRYDVNFIRDAYAYMQTHSLPEGRKYFDVMAFHQYDAFRDDWDDGSATLPLNQGVIAKARQSAGAQLAIGQLMSNYGLDKPLAAFEVGLQVSSGCTSKAVCEDLQACRVVHVNVRGMAADLEIITWYTVVDKPGELEYGLLRSDLSPRPAYYAYQTLTEELAGYSFVRQLPTAETGSSRIQGYVFSKGSGSNKVVLWRDDGQRLKSQSLTATESMSLSAIQLGTWTGRVRIVDKFGTETIRDSGGADSITLSFSSDPIYVEAVQ